MLNFVPKHPTARGQEEAYLGMIPLFVNEGDPSPASQQFDRAYQHGGGWRPFQGFKMLPNGDIKYPGDPTHRVMFEAKFRDETIRVYESAWVAIVQPDGSFEISRMD